MHPIVHETYGVTKLPYFVNSNVVSFSTIPTKLVRIGSTVDDYAEKIKSKMDATSNYSRRATTVLRGEYGFIEQTAVNRLTNNQTVNFTRGYPPCALLSDHDSDTMVPASADNYAKASFVRHATSRMSELQGGVMAAELGKAIKSVFNPFGAAARLILTGSRKLEKSLLKRRRRRSFTRKTWTRDDIRRDAEKVIQESWIETQFALKPTLEDLKGCARALARVIGGFYPPEHVSSDEVKFDYIHTPYSLDASVGSFSGGVVCRASRRYYVSGSVRYKAAIHSEFLAPGLRTFGFTSEQFLPSLWEWLPYSWLVDYFLPVGDALNAISFPTASLQYCTRAVKCTSREVHSSGDLTAFTASLPLAELSRSNHSSRFEIVRESYVRTNAKAFGAFIPTKSWSMPDFKQSLNIGAVLLGQKICRDTVHKLLTLEKI